MQEVTTSNSRKRKFLGGNSTLTIGIAAIIFILVIAAIVLFYTLPDANAFNDRVEQIFIENDNLTSNASNCWKFWPNRAPRFPTRLPVIDS
ncbi:MAG: hypothetical protein GXP03_10440 [Alphaproteobacteria bacterium]|nr:hypothetical protein [Alphaproteobacteria bacterium]